MSPSWRRPLAELLMRGAATRLRRRYPDFAEAMVCEAQALGDTERLRWAVGCLAASFRAPGMAEVFAYPLALAAGVAAMVAYQWSADESLLTLALTCAIGLCLGLIDPRRFLLSGLAVGVVVTGVNAFESITGILPAYEAASHGLVRNLRWLVLAPPAVLCAAAGRELALRLHGRASTPLVGD